MEFETLERKLAERGARIGTLKQKLYRTLAAHLPEELEIRAAGEGLSSANGSYAPVIVSPGAVYIAAAAGLSGTAELVEVARELITAVEVSGRILRKLTIHTATDRYVVRAVSKRQALAITEELNSQ